MPPDPATDAAEPRAPRRPSFWSLLRRAHRHPLNIGLHVIGIPAIVLSLWMVFFDWQLALVLFVGGWICQLAGHWIEGEPPAFVTWVRRT